MSIPNGMIAPGRPSQFGALEIGEDDAVCCLGLPIMSEVGECGEGEGSRGIKRGKT